VARIVTASMGVALALIVFGAASLNRADAGAASQAGPVAGYFDPETNKFTPLVGSVPAVRAPAGPIRVTKITGTLVITVSIALDPHIAAKDTVTAICNASTTDPISRGSVGFEKTVEHSGPAGKITFTMPFLFPITTSSDTMTVALTIDTQTASGNRLESTTASLPLPKNGTNTISLAVGM
jgi:hypothetical protein